MGIEDCRIIQFKKIADPRGNLTPIEGGQDIPFEIRRVFYLYDVPGGAFRAGHANKKVDQVIIAVVGSFDVVVKDGLNSMRYRLNRSNHGLFLPRMLWRELEDFSSGAVSMVMASDHYDGSDYYRDFKEFQAAVSGK